MAPPPIHLTILRKGDTNIVDLAEVGSLIPRSETQVDGAFLQELVAEFARIATPEHNRKDGQAAGSEAAVWQPGTAIRDLRRIGGLIFSHLLTEPARKRLRMAESCDLYLRLDDQLIHIPWELGYDGNDFLATKFRVGRQVITSYPLPETSGEQTARGSLRVLIIADPTESLPEAGDEADRLCTLLDEVPGVEVTQLSGKVVRKVSLLTLLQAHEIVHFAGHSYYDSNTPSKSGWRLHEGVLTAEELSKLTHPPLLVFSNSCQAGTTARWEGGSPYEGQVFGIGSAFLLAGVKNYIGTFWVVHDEESVLFATAFYRSLASGLSLGKALLQARQEIIRQKGWESLTWASYMLYGDPTFTLLPAAGERLPPVSVSSEKTAQEKLSEASAPSPLEKKKRWWSWRPQLRLRAVISLSVTLVTIFSFVYWLSQVRTPPPPTPHLFVLREYEIAFENLKAGQIDVALSSFHWLVAYPENSFGLGYDGLAAIYFEKGLVAEAKEAIQKSLAANAASVIALLIQGDIFFAMGEREKAADQYMGATKRRTQWGWQKALAYNALGVSYSLEGMSAKARNCFNEALLSDGGSFAAYSNLGYLSWREGNVQEAQRSFAKARDLQRDDELSQTFAEMIGEKGSDDLTKGVGEKVLIMPFALGGGNLRRLGEGEALAWKLARHLPSSAQPEIVSQDLLLEGRQGELLHSPEALVNLAREKGAAYIVWGELQSFITKLIIHGQVAEVKTGTVTRVSSVQEGTSGRLEAAAQVLAEQVSAALVREQG
jgi:tetratricopeptide (TPR) repeat protein